MPTENEVRVMQILNAIEVPDGAGEVIENWGNEAVTIVCETALGSYSGLHDKIRHNAVDLLGSLTHPQARETVLLLLSDSDPDISIRAMRAAPQQQNKAAVAQLGNVLKTRELPPLVAAEALRALVAFDSPEARSVVVAYAASNADEFPHRGSAVVARVLPQ